MQLTSGQPEAWLITYDLHADAQPGQTFRASIASAAELAVSGSLSGPTTALGLPVASATHDVGGTLTASLGPNTPGGGTV